MDIDKAWEKLKQDKGKQEFVVLWGGFAVLGLILFIFCSDRDFSFLLTLAAMLSCCSFAMVAYNIQVTQSCAGVSTKMIECYLVVTLSRLCSILPFDGYLPYDRSGDWLYRLIEILIAVMTIGILYMCRVAYANTYEFDKDKELQHVYLLGVAFVLAVLFHPSLNNYILTDIAWAYALYLESVAALPQLMMFTKSTEAQPFISHFLAGQVTSKCMSFLFWMSSYHELSDKRHAFLPKRFVGGWAMIVQFFQLIVMGDFMYKYIQCLRKGVSVSQLLVADEV
jgi:hypothetical protein